MAANESRKRFRSLASSASGLSDESVMALVTDVAALASDVARVQAVLAGVVFQRSRREDGHSGLAAVHGHATPASLIQSITGGTRADANRQVRVGSALVEGAGGAAADTGAEEALRHVPWHDMLNRAFLDGRLTAEEKDAIRLGLGEPRAGVDAPADVELAWSLAAEGLVSEGRGMPVEELVRRARGVRDLLDPEGAEQRYAHRFEKRSFAMYVDGDGQHRARIAFDDEMAVWVRSTLDAALRPRRGGPRFMTDAERAEADELVSDPRTNRQLEYDLVMDVLRAGSLAQAQDVFGARQPGVRMIVVKDVVGPRDPFGRLLAVGHVEDGGDALPGSVIDRNLCMHGSQDVIVDGCGNPLDLGREQRLFSAKQRVALAARDGGCVWPGCTRVASYCEAHHIDHYAEHGGRTDIDRGILLCRFHHLLLHNRGWRITRMSRDAFVLHPPPGEGPSVVLRSKSAWQWAWDPPPPPKRVGWRVGAGLRGATTDDAAALAG